MDQEKLKFVTEDCIPLFNSIQEESTAKWGKMNAWQMIEHVAAVFAVSAGKIKFELATPEELLPKYRAFLYSDKEFRENTKAPDGVLGEEPPPLRYASMDEAKEKLAATIKHFTDNFVNEPEKRIMHPAFGELNYAEWVLVHYKHVTHHLKQFAVL